ncbi:ankyrin repeat protein [Cotonvirus japonicus]|uniref:Ankyrin repeat protein n=1 Tax=Cotonvirus japonicus TaxID=2811091 RepID=A0ABM7NSF0_9VIRU|nr:ankyrin repeat protein [Cotonvirus japonicus]BCS83061.1 ankyrin repeat protein [Cotonvirus japonicus]
MNQPKHLIRTKQAFKKIKKIETELFNGDFTNYYYFKSYSGKQGLEYLFEWSSFYGKIKIIQELVKEFGVSSFSNNVIDTSLQMACKNNYLNVVKFLVKNFETKTPNAIYEAIENNNIDIIKYLLNLKCDDGNLKFNIHDQYDYAIRLAMEVNNYECIVELIHSGANVNIFDGFLFRQASQSSNPKIVNLFKNLSNK